LLIIDHPNAAGKTFLASDGDDLSLTDLLGLIRKAMHKPALLIPVPSFLFKLLGKVMGKTSVVNRLVGNLQVDSSDAITLLGWQPPYTVEQGIKTTVNDFLDKPYR
jgi:UDP-glucose 4-epimerase